MTVIDFHPEELLEREGSGTLSGAERQRLDAHLARCTSCRLELQLRADFERELGALEAPGMLQALVSGALRAVGGPEKRAERQPGSRPQPQPESQPQLVGTRRSLPRRSRRPLAVLLAAGVVLGTALAAAHPDIAVRALDVAREQVRSLLGGGSEPRIEAPPESPARAPRAPVRASAPQLGGTSKGPPTPSSAEDAVEPTTSGAPPPAPEVALGSNPASAKRQPGAAKTTPPDAARLPSVQSPAEPSPAETARREPAVLFDRANAARRGGSGAEGLYEELQLRFPESAEARLSQAILGRMQLDSGAAAQAIAHFEAYLATGDAALREQAMAGCALAWEHLGQSERGRQSWRALLAAYPDSSYAQLARQHLDQETR